jgi:hypothetical protein
MRWNVKIDPDELAGKPVTIGGIKRQKRRGSPTIAAALKAIETQRELDRIRRLTEARFRSFLAAYIADGEFPQ